MATMTPEDAMAWIDERHGTLSFPLGRPGHSHVIAALPGERWAESALIAPEGPTRYSDAIARAVSQLRHKMLLGEGE